ncbi:SMC-Scp complex subunit ScpB [bacterium]|nr:SMC-Scp complex subunit ScpB [bacterium]
MDHKKLKSVIESLLFVSGEPVKISKLAKITQAPAPSIENAIMELSGEYLGKKRGIVIIKKDNEVQLATSPDNSLYSGKLVESELKESLSRVSLEVLSVIAYRGPITRSDIEAVRGVNSSFTLRNLLMRGLIERVENSKNKRQYLFRISFDFLKKLGLSSVKELPDYEKVSKDERVDSVKQ